MSRHLCECKIRKDWIEAVDLYLTFGNFDKSVAELFRGTFNLCTFNEKSVQSRSVYGNFLLNSFRRIETGCFLCVQLCKFYK